MSEWIRLDEEEIARLDRQLSGQSEENGIEINVYMSPYNVPLAVRADYDKSKDRFVIHLKYISDEPVTRRPGEDRITLAVGKHSGRLYGIEIDTGDLDVKAVRLQLHVQQEIDRTLQHLLEDPPEWLRPQSYSVAKQVISDKSDQLFSRLTPA